MPESIQIQMRRFQSAIAAVGFELQVDAIDQAQPFFRATVRRVDEALPPLLFNASSDANGQIAFGLWPSLEPDSDALFVRTAKLFGDTEALNFDAIAIGVRQAAFSHGALFMKEEPGLREDTEPRARTSKEALLGSSGPAEDTRDAGAYEVSISPLQTPAGRDLLGLTAHALEGLLGRPEISLEEGFSAEQVARLAIAAGIMTHRLLESSAEAYLSSRDQVQAVLDDLVEHRGADEAGMTHDCTDGEGREHS